MGELRFRRATAADVPGIRRAHAASVRGLAATAYGPEVVEAWAAPLSAEQLAGYAQALEDGTEPTWVAVDEAGAVVGFAAIVTGFAVRADGACEAAGELRAVYVAPEAARRGAGKTLARLVEADAVERGVAVLTLEASVNAVPFYEANGYEAVARYERRVGRAQVAMAAVVMRKVLRLPAVKAVLFDLDGTLLDSVAIVLDAIQAATRAHLATVPTRDELMPYVGRRGPDVMRALAGCGAGRQGRSDADDGLEEVADRMLATYRAHLAATPPPLFPQAREAVDELRRRGFRVGVVTSKTRSLTETALAPAALPFDVVITADDVTRHKPDPLPLLVAAERLGLRPSDCAYVGDTTIDVAAARGAGMTSIGVAWGAGVRDALVVAGAARVMATFDGLPRALARPSS